MTASNFLTYLTETDGSSYYKGLRREGAVLLDREGHDISTANALPVQGPYDYIDLVNNPATVWVITREDGQPDSEQITLENGNVYIRTFTYTGSILTARSKWELQ